jgi:hypothetical protein
MPKNPNSPPASDASPDGCEETPESSPAPSGGPTSAEAQDSQGAREGPERAEPVAGRHQIPVKEIDGKRYVLNAAGGWTPEESVKEQHVLEDQIVRGLIAEALELSARLSAFRARCFEEVVILNALLADQYGAKGRGAKGNQTLATYDGLARLQVQVADLITFGPELQTAKALIDECLNEWVAGSPVQLQAVVDYAFQVDKEGQINKGRLLGLRRMKVDDPRWARAMEAIADSIRVTGSKQYVRFHRRVTHLAGWSHVSLDLATA